MNEIDEDLGIVESRAPISALNTSSKLSSGKKRKRKASKNDENEKGDKHLTKEMSENLIQVGKVVGQRKEVEMEVETQSKLKASQTKIRKNIGQKSVKDEEGDDERGDNHNIGVNEEKNNEFRKSKRRNTKFDTFRKELPVYSHRLEILDAIKLHRSLIIAGETGSGKSTQIPHYLFEEVDDYIKDLCLFKEPNITVEKQLERRQGKKMKLRHHNTFSSSLSPSLSNSNVGETVNTIDNKRNKGKPRKMIVITQPRRVAAINVARRVAEEVGCKLGSTVGYSVRFDEVVSDDTKLKYVTDGVLLREAMTDGLLSNYSVIVLDEAHERSLQTDILLGLIKNIMRKRNDLRIIVMSATIDINLYSTFFPDPVVVKVKGRQHPVDVFYLKEKVGDTLDIVCSSILQVHNDLNDVNEESNINPSTINDDILVFLPGQEDIENMMDLITSHTECLTPSGSDKGKDVRRITTIYSDSARHDKTRDDNDNGNAHTKNENNSDDGDNDSNHNNKSYHFQRKKPQLIPLYAALPQEEQAKAFLKAAPGYRKIILSTNIAETSVTISGVKSVIDSALVKMRHFQPETNMDSLLLKRTSKAQAQQRAGRAGRECPGLCYRLLTENEYSLCEQNTSPEIERVNLAQVILQLLVIRKGEDPLNFDFISPPSMKSIKQAIEELKELQCIKILHKSNDNSTTKFEVTPHGYQVSLLPLTPLLAHLLLLSQNSEYNCTYEVLLAVAMLSVESPFYKPSHSNKMQQEKSLKAHKRFLQPEGDLPTLIRIIQNWKSVKGDYRWCQNNYINHKNMIKANEVLNQLKRLLEKMDIDVMVSCGAEFDKFLNCIAFALSSNVAKRIPEGRGAYKSLSSGKEIYIHPSSSLHGRNPPPQAIAYVETQVTSKIFVKQVTMINPTILSQVKLSGKSYV